MSQLVFEPAYPNYVIKKPDFSQSNLHEFGPVFIVLAGIIVISALACVFGRFCNGQKHEEHHHNKEADHHNKEAHHDEGEGPKVEAADKPSPSQLGHREWESTQRAPIFKLRERGDVELGFDNRAPSARMPANMVAPPHYNGGDQPHVRFADNV